jgi:hypothetical protein
MTIAPRPFQLGHFTYRTFIGFILTLEKIAEKTSGRGRYVFSKIMELREEVVMDR